MKVKLNDLQTKFLSENTTTIYFKNIYQTIGSIINQWQSEDLTIIGNWDSVEDCFKFVKKRITNYALKNINFLNSFEMESQDFTQFLLSGVYLDDKNDTTTKTKNSGTSNFIHEDSPITEGDSFDINTPDEKSKSKTDSTREYNKTDKNIKDSIDRLKFLEKYKCVYAIFENYLLNLTDEFTVVY